MKKALTALILKKVKYVEIHNRCDDRRGNRLCDMRYSERKWEGLGCPHEKI